jgi:hypothetical protein
LNSYLREAITLFIELQQVDAEVLVHKEQTGKRTTCGKKLKNDICNKYTDEKKVCFSIYNVIKVSPCIKPPAIVKQNQNNGLQSCLQAKLMEISC